jgi:hypothetical protein
MSSKNAPQVDAAARGGAFGAALRAVRGALAFAGGAASSVHAGLRCASLGRCGNAFGDDAGAEDVSSDRIASVRVRPVAIANALARAVAPCGITRRAFCLGSFLLAFFCLASVIAHGGDLYILTKTELHSANYLWSEEREENSYDEFSDDFYYEKGNFPQDLYRKNIGVGELINLKVKGPSELIGDVNLATWEIVLGSEWAELTVFNGEVAVLGAKPINGPSSRTVEVQVTTRPPGMAPKTARVTITILKPNGVLCSRHAAPSPSDVDIPSTKQFLDLYTPGSQEPGKTLVLAFGVGAWTKLVVIPMPSNVNFGGSYGGGVSLLEKDLLSPPSPGTYTPDIPFPWLPPPPYSGTPEERSIFEYFTHKPNRDPAKIDKDIAGVIDVISFYADQVVFLRSEHTCNWTCGIEWNGIPLAQVVQNFRVWNDPAFIIDALMGKVSKFNSSVVRNTYSRVQTRDTENDWKP